MIMKMPFDAKEGVAKELEKIEKNPYGGINLQIEAEDKEYEFFINQLHDIDTEHPEYQQYDLFYNNINVGRDMSFCEMATLIDRIIYIKGAM